MTSLRRVVDLAVGESVTVELHDGSKATVKLVDLTETRDEFRNAVREANVIVEINNRRATLVSANYNLPVTLGGVQVDCPITGGYLKKSGRDSWGLAKDVRLRLWPVDSPWIQPGTFMYPARQRWFANDTQMANEPTFVDGGEYPRDAVYYHNGLDIGGADGYVEIVAATDGLVVSASNQVAEGHEDSPMGPRPFWV